MNVHRAFPALNDEYRLTGKVAHSYTSRDQRTREIKAVRFPKIKDRSPKKANALGLSLEPSVLTIKYNYNYI